MNKKCTLLAAALMVASAFTATAASVAPTQVVAAADWTATKYYYLQTGTNYLSLSGTKADSVIVKTIDFASASKSSLDSALWEITNAGTETAGTVYQLKNKKTQAILSFAASSAANTNIVPGIAKWAISSTGTISASYGSGKIMGLQVTGTVLGLSTIAPTTEFEVMKPDSALTLKANELGAGFQVFQLAFGSTYTGDEFSGKDLLAKQVGATDYVNLQVSGGNGNMFFGVDTLKTTISGATGAYGATFSLDSIRTARWPNADYKQFMFTIDLMNDSLAMYVKAAPDVNATAPLGSVNNVRVVVATLASANALTVSAVTDFGVNNAPTQGIAPLITLKKGTPSTIATGDGVYFLKSASKGANAGKFFTYVGATGLTVSDTIPNIYQPTGQWLIKNNNGMYSIVDRKGNTTALLNQEIFAVQGMPNTYTLGNGTDSVTVVYQSGVDTKNKFLGSRYFTAVEMADNGYVLNLISGTSGVSNLFAFTSDSILKIKSGDSADAIALRMVASGTPAEVGGAKLLGDTLYQASYTLKEQFGTNFVALDGTVNALKLSNTVTPSVFTFNVAPVGGKYTMTTGAGNDENVSFDVTTSNLILTGTVAYFDFKAVAAPEYAGFGSGHKSFTTNAQSLTMNPLNFFAESKIEGQPIVKADYTTDNFSLWVDTTSIANGTPGKQLYFISTSIPSVTPTPTAATNNRYYMVSLRDSSKFDALGNPRVGFLQYDSITTMENSPALFAFKTTEDGYWLENQREANRVTRATTSTPYVAVMNSVVVMSSEGAPFTIEGVAGPVKNETIQTSDVKVIGGVGSVTVQNAHGKRVMVSNILGQVVSSLQVTSDSFIIPAPRGVVVIAVEGETPLKALVK